MDDISIIEYEDVDLSNSMLIVAFPTVGLISSIAGHFIIDSLKLDPIGTITSNQFMPATVIHKSIPFESMREKRNVDQTIHVIQLLSLFQSLCPHQTS